MILYELKVFSETNTKGEALGLFRKIEDPLNIVENNIGDLYEQGAYPFVCIFPIRTNELFVYSNPEKEKWFRWDENNKKYFPIDRPESLKDYVLTL